MRIYIDAVRLFMQTKGIPVDGRMPTKASELMQQLADRQEAFAQSWDEHLRQYPDDARFMRAQGMAEELGELLQAFAEGDEIAAMDALGDLMYFAIGTGVAFDWPMMDVLAEIHMSNMTKERESTLENADDRAADRLRTKGNKYKAPDLKGVLERHRAPRPLMQRDVREGATVLGQTAKRWQDKAKADASTENLKE